MKLKTDYLSFGIKKAIVEQVVNNCVVYDGDLMILDFIQKEMAFTLSLLQFYTDENIEDIDLDMYYQNGKIYELKKLIPHSELSFLEKAIENTIDEKKGIYNSVSGVLSRGIDKLIAKIPSKEDMNGILTEENLAMVQKYADIFTNNPNRQQRRKAEKEKKI